MSERARPLAPQMFLSALVFDGAPGPTRTGTKMTAQELLSPHSSNLNSNLIQIFEILRPGRITLLVPFRLARLQGFCEF